MSGTKPKFAWLDGAFVPYEEARLHVRTDCVMSGSNVFEGLRAYWSDEEQELYLFRLADHMRRLGQSMKPLWLRPPFSLAEIEAAVLELLRLCEFRSDVHIRPTCYFGDGERFGIDPDKIQMGAFITAVPAPSVLASHPGLRAGISTWRRVSDQNMPPRIKAGANYYNGRLAMVEARLAGYDTAILLNEQGKVTEGWGNCLFIVRDGVPIVPPFSSGILESITRDTVIRLCRSELGIEVMEREIDRTELYLADEAFLCGTAAEITPIISVDRLPVSAGQPGPGPLTARLMALYREVVCGRSVAHRHWLTPVWGGMPRTHEEG